MKKIFCLVVGLITLFLFPPLIFANDLQNIKYVDVSMYDSRNFNTNILISLKPSELQENQLPLGKLRILVGPDQNAKIEFDENKVMEINFSPSDLKNTENAQIKVSNINPKEVKITAGANTISLPTGATTLYAMSRFVFNKDDIIVYTVDGKLFHIHPVFN